MSFKCPLAPAGANPALVLQTLPLSAGTKLFRFHGTTYGADTFNPNIGRRIEVPEDGARFNPFPGAPADNIGTLYAADTFEAAALESVFHAVEHVPSPDFPRVQLADWRYSRLEVTQDLVLLELVNPRLRQLPVRGRKASISEGELIHSPPGQYPNTRTWARFLHASMPGLAGLAWRPRLGGTGQAFVFFGDRCRSGVLEAKSKPIPVAVGPGYQQLCRVARAASIRMIGPA